MGPRRSAVLLALVMALAGCGGTAQKAAPSSARTSPPSVIDVGGEVVVTDLDAVRFSGSGDTCITLTPYDDVAEGRLVTVRRDTGTRVAVTALVAGRLRNGTAGRPAGCSFAFSFAGAPGGRPTYDVQVGSRTPVAVPVARIGRIRIDLGPANLLREPSHPG